MNSNDIISYKCPSCGSALVYGVDGKLSCSFCGNSYETDAIKMLERSEEESKGFDWGDYTKKFENEKEVLDNTAVYVCRSCGAAIEADETLAATHCPYCDSEIILSDRLTGGLKPNAVIPFKISEKTLENSIKNYFKNKPLLPSNFINKQKMSKIKGIYVPFWLFDSKIDGQMFMNASKIRYYSDAHYNYTETKHYIIELDGKMNFAKIPVDASVKMDNDLMDAIEPYDYSDLVDFDPAYLSGFFADRFDEDPEKSLPRAESRMNESAEAVFKSSVEGFDSISLKSKNLKLMDSTVKYVLLPVYLLNLKYMGKNYRFAVNGQTGKVVGELPISKFKKFMYYLGITAASAGIIWLILTLIHIL
jgi:DNA-directed RNA polymerase subunit RPC12/RpoP